MMWGQMEISCSPLLRKVRQSSLPVGRLHRQGPQAAVSNRVLFAMLFSIVICFPQYNMVELGS